MIAILGDGVNMFARSLVGTIVGGAVLIAARAGAVADIGKNYAYFFI